MARAKLIRLIPSPLHIMCAGAQQRKCIVRKLRIQQNIVYINLHLLSRMHFSRSFWVCRDVVGRPGWGCACADRHTDCLVWRWQKLCYHLIVAINCSSWALLRTYEDCWCLSCFLSFATQKFIRSRAQQQQLQH